MTKELKITVLVENSVHEEGLLAEHGLAYLIETDDQSILFDTGQGYSLLHNVERLNISLSRINTVVLSHGHFDHTGALDSVMNVAHGSKIYVHPDAFQPKYSVRNGSSKNIGCRCNIDLTKDKHRFRWTQGITQINGSIFITGEIPRKNDIEDVGGPFFNDPYSLEPDRLMDDQALYFKTEAGIVVLLGCAHAGVMNTLEYIQENTAKTKFHALIGGMHLLNASEERLQTTIEKLKEYHFDLIVPLHCTGSHAKALLAKEFTDQYQDWSVNSSRVFNVAE